MAMIEVKEQCKSCFHYQVCANVLKQQLFIREYMLKQENPKCEQYIPTADVVEVVRCKDCGSYNKHYGECTLNGSHFGENGYCCRGTRTPQKEVSNGVQ